MGVLVIETTFLNGKSRLDINYSEDFFIQYKKILLIYCRNREKIN